MVRNTRSVTQLHLPPRFAWTVRVIPITERDLFTGMSVTLSPARFKKPRGTAQDDPAEIIRGRRIISSGGLANAGENGLGKRKRSRPESRKTPGPEQRIPKGRKD